jgi:hypothetical protein
LAAAASAALKVIDWPAGIKKPSEVVGVVPSSVKRAAIVPPPSACTTA